MCVYVSHSLSLCVCVCMCVFKILDQKTRDWLDDEGLLWVYKEGHNVRIRQECRQQPQFIEGEPECEIRNIIGHYCTQTGLVYFSRRDIVLLLEQCVTSPVQ
jgi:hypothetical protein